MDAFTLAARLTLDSSAYDQGLNNAKDSGSKLGGALKTAFKVGMAAVAAATTAVTAFAGSSVSAGMQFDASMSQVAATMGYTMAEMNEEGSAAATTLETLRNFAQEMGSTTAFSASQAADALNYMALAGYDAETSMTMLPNVLNLAAAGGIELAAASDMVTDASSALGLSLEETALLVDQMAKASSKSNTSVAQLGDAILTVGGTAKNLHDGTVELSTALGILADNGIKGAEGGTTLRNIILSLSSPTDAAAKKLEELGVSVFDTAGEMRPLGVIFDGLAAEMQKLDQQAQIDALGTIFNKVDLKGANALLAAGVDRWDELYDAIENADGAAAAMAEVQLDNLAGDITLFQSALEGAKIAVSDGLTPTLRNFVQFGTDGLSRLTQAFQEGGLDSAMDVFGDILSDGLLMITEKIPDIVDAGTKLLGALLQGLSENSDTIANAVVLIMTSLAQFVMDNLPLVLATGIDIIIAFANGIADNLPELIPAVVDMVFQIVDTLTDPETLSNLVDASIAIMLALANGLIDAVPSLIEKAPEIVLNLVTALIENAPKLVGAALEIILSLAQSLIDNGPELFHAAGEIIGSIAQGIVQTLNRIDEVADELINGFIEKLSEWDPLQWGKDLVTNLIDGIKEGWNNLKNGVSEVAQGIKNFLGFSEPKEGPLSDFHTYAPDMMKLFAEGIRDNEDLITDQIKKSFDFDMISVERGSQLGGRYPIAPMQTAADGNREIVINLTTTMDGSVLSRKMYRLNQEEEARHGESFVSYA